MNQHDRERIARVMGRKSMSVAERRWRLAVQAWRTSCRIAHAADASVTWRGEQAAARLADPAQWRRAFEWAEADEPARRCRREAHRRNRDQSRMAPHRRRNVGWRDWIDRHAYHAEPSLIDPHGWQVARGLPGVRGCGPALTPNCRDRERLRHEREGRVARLVDRVFAETFPLPAASG